MIRFIRYLFLITVATVFTYWLVLYQPGAPLLPGGDRPEPRPVEIAVVPSVEAQPATVPASEEEVAPAPPDAAAPPPVVKAEPDPTPPPETGAPDGADEAKGISPSEETQRDARSHEPTFASERAPSEIEEKAMDAGAKAAAEKAERVREEIRGISRSETLLQQATEEISGQARRGFKSVFLAAAAEQFAIARFFGEPLVLIPRAGLNPRAPYYYQLTGNPPEVTKIREAAPLERFRRYRDLLRYRYKDLPRAVRTLRRQVPNRTDVYLFAALIPPSEWALAIARRKAALVRHNSRRPGKERTESDVSEFVMDYVPLPGGGFDIRVKAIVFADGTRWTAQDES